MALFGRLGFGRWVSAVVVVSGLISGSQPACNLVVDTNTEQCKTTADCTAKGPEFATSVCTPDHVCSTGGDCKTNQECIDRVKGAPAICRKPDFVCVNVTTTDCAEVFPSDALGDDSTILLGFMGPLTGADASSGQPTWKGVKLATNEIQVTANGLPVRGGTDRKRIAFVACDDANDPIAVAKHMAQSLKVPGIIGPSFSGVALDVATKVTIPAGVLLMSPSATSPSLTKLNDNGLFWRTAPSDALQSIPMAKLVSDLETQIKSATTPPPPALIKVAMTAKNDAYGSGLADATIAKLVFNGKAAGDNGDNFLRLDYPDPNPDFSSVVSAIVTMAPHVIVGIGTTEVATGVVSGVEAAWTATTRPYYVLSDGVKIDELLALTNGNDNLRKRILGTFPGRTTPLYQQFNVRYKAFYQNEVPGAYAANAYDAAYLFAYALVSTSDQTPSGQALNQGLKNTVGGQKFDAGPSSLTPAFSVLLQAGGKIDYNGVSGPLDFDVDTGEAPADIDVWCITSANAYVSSGQYYDSANDVVTGQRTACN